MNTNTTKAIFEMAKSLQSFTEKTNSIFKNISNNNADEIETIEPLYVNPKFNNTFKMPTVYRFNQTGMRYYFTAEDDNVLFYPSVTTIISNTTPMGYGLKKILAEKGMAGYNQFMKEKAEYGTLLHILISDYLRSGDSAKARSFDFDDMDGRIALYAEEKNISYPIDYWSWNLKKDLASLIQFIYEYEVEPIAIEAVGVYNDGKYHFAGALDLLCELTITEKGYFGEVYKSGENKGNPKLSSQKRRVTAIVDFKSGKSGFFDDHEIQLEMYKMMAQASFGFTPEKLFNVSPKDWSGETPTFSIADQTDSPLAAKIPFMLGQYAVEWKEPKDILMINGKVNGTGFSEAIRFVSAKEFMLRKLGRKVLPKQEPNPDALSLEEAMEVVETADDFLFNN